MIKKFKLLMTYKKAVIEILETLATICLYLDFESRTTHNHNRYGQFMMGHFDQLKKHSERLRKGDEYENEVPAKPLYVSPWQKEE